MLNEYMSVGELGEALIDCATAGNMKEAAVCAFVLARKCQLEQDESMARHFARKCLELLRECPADTLEQCTHPYVTVGGVLIPGLFHEGTVRRELASVLQ